MQAARIQVAHGRLFAFEHPASASSWQEDCVTEVANMPGVMKVTFDQCQFGLVTPVLRTPMKKPTRILTNSSSLVNRFQGARCDRSHAHQEMRGSEGGVKLSAHAQVYSPELVQAILDGVWPAV